MYAVRVFLCVCVHVLYMYMCMHLLYNTNRFINTVINVAHAHILDQLIIIGEARVMVDGVEVGGW